LKCKRKKKGPRWSHPGRGEGSQRKKENIRRSIFVRPNVLAGTKKSNVLGTKLEQTRWYDWEREKLKTSQPKKKKREGGEG